MTLDQLLAQYFKELKPEIDISARIKQAVHPTFRYAPPNMDFFAVQQQTSVIFAAAFSSWKQLPLR